MIKNVVLQKYIICAHKALHLLDAALIMWHVNIMRSMVSLFLSRPSKNPTSCHPVTSHQPHWMDEQTQTLLYNPTNTHNIELWALHLLWQNVIPKRSEIAHKKNIYQSKSYDKPLRLNFFRSIITAQFDPPTHAFLYMYIYIKQSLTQWGSKGGGAPWTLSLCLLSERVLFAGNCTWNRIIIGR